MLAAVDPGASTALTVALIGTFGVIFAALLTGIVMWQVNRRVGKPNGQGNLTELTTKVLEQVGEARLEARQARDDVVLTRGMVEGFGTELRAHQREDRENFARLFGDKYEGGV